MDVEKDLVEYIFMWIYVVKIQLLFTKFFKKKYVKVYRNFIGEVINKY